MKRYGRIQKQITNDLIRIHNEKLNGKSKLAYKPQKIELSDIETSPVFADPQKWVSKFRMIDSSERIQSYKPLEESAIAQLLTSPPRMLHNSRTVLPRDFLTGIRLMDCSNIVHDESNVGGYKYTIVPFHPDEKKLPNDPVTYYSNSYSLFKDYGKTSTAQMSQLFKNTINLNLYPNITNPKRVGWIKDTYKVVDLMKIDEIKKHLVNFEDDSNPTCSKLILENSESADHKLTVRDNTIHLNIFQITEHSPELASVLSEKIKKNYIPIVPSNLELIRSIIKYIMFLNN